MTGPDGPQVGSGHITINYDVDTAAALSKVKTFQKTAEAAAKDIKSRVDVDTTRATAQLQSWRLFAEKTSRFTVTPDVDSSRILAKQGEFRAIGDRLGKMFVDGHRARLAQYADEISRDTVSTRKIEEKSAADGRKAGTAFTREMDNVFKDAVRRGTATVRPDVDTSTFNGRLTNMIRTSFGDRDKDVDRHGRTWGERAGAAFGGVFEGVMSLLPSRLESVFTRTGPVIGGALAAAIGGGLMIALPAAISGLAGAGFVGLAAGALAAGIFLVKDDPRVQAAAQSVAKMFHDKIWNSQGAEDMVQKVVPALNKIRDALSAWAPMISQILSAASQFLPPLTDGLIGFVNALLPPLTRLMESTFLKDLVQIASTGITKIGQAIGDVFNRILADPEAMKGIKMGFEDLMNLAASFIRLMGDVIMWAGRTWAKFNTDPDGAGPALSGIDTLRKNWKDFRDGIQPVIDLLTNLWHILEKITGTSPPGIPEQATNAAGRMQSALDGRPGTSGNPNAGRAGSALPGPGGDFMAFLGDINKSVKEGREAKNKDPKKNQTDETVKSILGKLWKGSEDPKDQAAGKNNGISQSLATKGPHASPAGKWLDEHGGGFDADNFNKMKAKAEQNIETFKGLWKGFATWIKDLWNSVWGGIKDIFANSWNRFVSFWTGVSDGFKAGWNGFWGGIKAAAAAAWNGVVSFFVGAWQSLTTQFNIGLEWLKTTWNTVWGGIKDFFVGIWNAIWAFLQGVWAGITAGFSAALTWIQNTWNSVWTWVSNFVSGIWNGITSGLQAAWDWIVNIFNSSLQWIQNTWNSVWDAVASFFSDIWNNIMQWAQSAWDWIVNIFTTSLDWIQNTWSSIWNWIAEFFSSIWQNIMDWLSQAWDWITSKIAAALDWVQNTWNSVWSAVSEFFSGIWEGIKSAVDSAINWVSDTIHSVLDTIHSKWNDIWEGLHNILSGAWDKIKSGVSTGIKAVCDLIDKGIGAINSVLDKLGVDFKIGLINFQGLSGGGPVNPRTGSAPGGGLASGGRVRGPGGPKDDMVQTSWRGSIGGHPPRVSPNEFVINAASSRKIGGRMLNYMNRHGGLPPGVPGGGFAGGGDIGAAVAAAKAAATAAGKGKKIVWRGAGGDNEGLMNEHRDHVHVGMAGVPMSTSGSGNPTINAIAAKSGIPNRPTSGYRAGDLGGRSWHAKGKATDFGGFNQDALALFFSRQPGISELIHRSATGDYGIFGNGGPAINAFLAKGIAFVMDKMLSPAMDALYSKMPKTGIGQIMGSMVGPKMKAALKKKIEDFIAAGSSSNGTGPVSTAAGSVAQKAWSQASLMGATRDELIALFEAGIVESGFANSSKMTDHDSVGFLQQRASQGWGTIAQIMDPAFATRSFLTRIKGTTGTPGQRAQKVQRSAYPAKYDAAQAQAIALLKQLGVPGFDEGGLLQPGATMVMNKTKKPEPVLTGQQWDSVMSNQEGDISIQVYIDDLPVDATVKIKKNNREIVNSLKRGRG